MIFYVHRIVENPCQITHIWNEISDIFHARDIFQHEILLIIYF